MSNCVKKEGKKEKTKWKQRKNKFGYKNKLIYFIF